MPASSVGALAPKSALRTIKLSPIFKLVVLTYVVVPDVVRLPEIVTSANAAVPVNVGPALGANVLLTYVLDAAYDTAFV